MAIALDSLGSRAVYLNAFQVRMETTSVYGSARLKKIDKERILHELAQPQDRHCDRFPGCEPL